MPKIELLTIEIDSEIKDQFEKLSALDERSMSANARWLIKSYIESHRINDEKQREPTNG